MNYCYSYLAPWDRGGGHVGVAVTPLGSGFTADAVRLGSRRNPEKVGVTTVRVTSSRQGALYGYGSRQGRSGYPEGCAAARATGNGSDSWR